MKAPLIPTEVLTWLEQEFPNELPRKPLPKEGYDVLVGQQTVLTRIRNEIKRQHKDISQHI